MKILQKFLLTFAAVFSVALLTLSLPSVQLWASGQSACTGLNLSTTVSNALLTSIINSNGPYGTNNAGTNLFYWITSTVITTNSQAIMVYNDHTASIYITNESPSNVVVSIQNPAVGPNGYIIKGNGTLTFPTIAGGGVPAILYCSPYPTNAFLASNDVIDVEQYWTITGP